MKSNKAASGKRSLSEKYVTRKGEWIDTIDLAGMDREYEALRRAAEGVVGVWAEWQRTGSHDTPVGDSIDALAVALEGR